MRNLLRAIVSWMDKRFPETVVITQEGFKNTMRRIDALEATKITEERIRKVESEITKFNAAMGFSGERIKAMPFTR